MEVEPTQRVEKDLPNVPTDEEMSNVSSDLFMAPGKTLEALNTDNTPHSPQRDEQQKT